MSSETNGNWFLSYKGRKINPFQMKPEDVDIEEIAHSLSLQCRFNGHCKFFYSVAQHSVLVAQILPQPFKLVGLLHDATEAYCSDMIRPIKVAMPDFQRLEDGIWEAIAYHFGLPVELPPEVKQADNEMLMTERRDLLPWTEDDWGVIEKPHAFRIRQVSPTEAENSFLYTYEKLRTMK